MAQDVPAATKAVGEFHAALDAGRFQPIYQATSSDMKTSLSEGDFVKLLDAVHRKLGVFRSGKVVGWRENATTSGTFVAVNYAAEYVRGHADEQFVYRIAGNRPVLAGYHVNSNAMFIN